MTTIIDVCNKDNVVLDSFTEDQNAIALAYCDIVGGVIRRRDLNPFMEQLEAGLRPYSLKVHLHVGRNIGQIIIRTMPMVLARGEYDLVWFDDEAAQRHIGKLGELDLKVWGKDFGDTLKYAMSLIDDYMTDETWALIEAGKNPEVESLLEGGEEDAPF